MNVRERLIRLTWEIANGVAVTSAYIQRKYGVSTATAKRDAALLQRVLQPAARPPGERFGIRKVKGAARDNSGIGSRAAHNVNQPVIAR